MLRALEWLHTPVRPLGARYILVEHNYDTGIQWEVASAPAASINPVRIILRRAVREVPAHHLEVIANLPASRRLSTAPVHVARKGEVGIDAEGRKFKVK